MLQNQNTNFNTLNQQGDYPEIKGFIRTTDGKLKIVEKGGKSQTLKTSKKSRNKFTDVIIAWKPFVVQDAHPHGGYPAGDGNHGEGDDDDDGEEE